MDTWQFPMRTQQFLQSHHSGLPNQSSAPVRSRPVPSLPTSLRHLQPFELL